MSAASSCPHPTSKVLAVPQMSAYATQCESMSSFTSSPLLTATTEEFSEPDTELVMSTELVIAVLAFVLTS